MLSSQHFLNLYPVLVGLHLSIQPQRFSRSMSSTKREDAWNGVNVFLSHSLLVCLSALFVCLPVYKAGFSLKERLLLFPVPRIYAGRAGRYQQIFLPEWPFFISFSLPLPNILFLSSCVKDSLNWGLGIFLFWVLKSSDVNILPLSEFL